MGSSDKLIFTNHCNVTEIDFKQLEEIRMETRVVCTIKGVVHLHHGTQYAICMLPGASMVPHYATNIV